MSRQQQSPPPVKEERMNRKFQRQMAAKHQALAENMELLQETKETGKSEAGMAVRQELMNKRWDLKKEVTQIKQKNAQMRRQQFKKYQQRRYIRNRKSHHKQVKASTLYKGEDTHTSNAPLTQLADPTTGQVRTDGAGVKRIVLQGMKDLMNP